MSASAWEWPGSHIINVVDGDTVDAMVTRDIGFNGFVTYPIRLRLGRINAPALSSDRGKRARRRVVDLVDAATVTITTYKPYKYGGPASSSGQYVAEVVLPDGSNLADLLVAEGLAVPWDGKGPRPEDD